MMNTMDQTIRINAFLDGELDLSSQLEMEERLQSDTELQRQVEEARQLRGAIREHADYHAAPEALRARMATLMSPPQASQPSAAASGSGPASVPHPASTSARPGERSPRADTRRPSTSSGIATIVQNWLSWRPLAASLSFAAIAAVAVNLLWLQSSRDEQLSDDVVASHVRSTLGQHLVDVSSSDHHTVKPFLSSKLGFSPPVDELAVPGSSFLGGRVDYLEGRPVAALVYKQGEHVVNSFVWPDKGSNNSPTYSIDRGFRLAHWTFNGMKHWIVSDVNAQEFDAVVKAVQQLDTAR